MSTSERGLVETSNADDRKAVNPGRATIERLAHEFAIEALLDLIDDLHDPDECWFDHHGYCQAHGWMTTEPSCPHARARKVLAARTESR